MSADISLKNSRTIQTPEQYVTIQIHNQNFKNKYKLHRSSVLNELRATQLILNQSLNKSSSIHQSNFARAARNSASQKAFKVSKESEIGQKRLAPKFDLVKQEPKKEKQYKMSPEISRKFRQLMNISYQLEKACEPKRKEIKQAENDIPHNYSLPVLEEIPEQKILKESPEHQKLKRQWRQKIRIGKKCTEHLKENSVLYNMLKNRRQKESLHQNILQNGLRTPQLIRDYYLQPRNIERKTAPLSQASTNFFNLFCSHKREKNNLYDRRVQLEPLVNIQQFASGGEQTPFKQYSSHLNLRQFMKVRERMSFLKRMYDYVKDKYTGEFKQMKAEQMSEANLLSLVYYIQNSINLTEQEKKAFRKKLKFID